MWHVHWDLQNDSNTDTRPGAQALARQTQRGVWWPTITVWPEATCLAAAAMSAERCFAVLPYRNSICLTSLLSQGVCDLCWVHAQKIRFGQRIKRDRFLEVSFLCACLLSCDSKGVTGFCLACHYPTQIPTTYRMIGKSWPSFLSLLLGFLQLFLGLDCNHNKSSDFKRVFLVGCFFT